MKSVNRWIIYAALGGLEETAVRRGETILDADDAAAIRRAFETSVVPCVRRWTNEWQDRLRLSMAYYRARPEVLDGILASLQDADIPEPRDVREFFNVLFHALFPGENPEDIDLHNAVESNDPMEMNNIQGA